MTKEEAKNLNEKIYKVSLELGDILYDVMSLQDGVNTDEEYDELESIIGDIEAALYSLPSFEGE